MVATATTTILKVDDRVERYAEQARLAGCPPDQFHNLINGGYIALPGMLPFHAAAREADKPDGPEAIALGGKRGPGKSHTVMAQVGLDDCQRVNNLKVLFLRKIQKSASESLEDLILRVFRYTPHQFAANRVSFPNGSRILIGGYKDNKDIDKYLGIEYDAIVLEEATQVSEDKKNKLRGSLRTSKQGWRPRLYMSTNANGIGLQWFKKMFVEPARAGTQTSTRFFDVSHIYNPFINPEYHVWLDTLTGSLRKAWREGDWDAFAGMAFPMWSYDIHVIEPFDIPEHWPKWRAIDWGFAAPWCCLWFTKDPDTRRLYIYREVYQAELTSSRQAERIKDLTPSAEKIMFTFADPAMWAKKDRKGEVYSTADEYKDNGVMLTKADNDRINGKRKVDESLSIALDGLPGLQIFET
ncbi:MAG: phage terminase large subunit, partial [bacterium]